MKSRFVYLSVLYIFS